MPAPFTISQFTDPSRDCFVQRYDYDGSGKVIYTGNAPPGSATSAAKWSIKRFTYSGTNLTVAEWAGGNNLCVNIWDNRASLTYS